VDVGYNGYATDPGAAFLVGGGSFGADGVLLCVSPDNAIPNGELQSGQTCPESFNPPKNESFWSKLNFNFSIGQAF
jgi:hypothetical protein